MSSVLLLGPGNSMAAIGASWRWVRDTAKRLGVPFLKVGRKQFVEANAFIAALDAWAHRGVVSEPDPEEAMRRRVFGPRKRAAASGALRKASS